MWTHKLFYLLLTGIALLFSILYLPPFSVYLFWSLLLAGVALFFLAHGCGCRVTAELLTPVGDVSADMPFTGTVLLHNESFLPIGTVSVVVCIENETLGETSFCRVSGTVPQRNDRPLEFVVTPTHCGKIRLELNQIKSYDWLHLFSHRAKKMPRAQFVTVLPKMDLSPDITFQHTAKAEASMHPTDSPEEFLWMREYQAGDRMRSIHWKLSSRLSAPVVRQYGMPEQEKFIVSLSYALLPDIPDPGDRLDTMLMTILTLVQAAYAANQTFQLLVCSDTDCTRSITAVPQMHCGILHTILESPPGHDPAACKAVLSQDGQIYDAWITDTPNGITLQFSDKTTPLLLRADTVAETIRQTLYEETP